MEQNPHMLWPIEEYNPIFKWLNENVGEDSFQSIRILYHH